MTIKVAVITGGASGIGLALAKKCLAKNMQVVIADNATLSLSQAFKTLRESFDAEVLGVCCDVAKPSEVEKLALTTYKKYGRVDLLINNAGISGKIAPIWELTPNEINKVLSINLSGVVNGVKAFLPLLFQQNHRAHIVNMGSVYSLCSGSFMSAYATAKHGVLAFSEALYFELKHFNKPVDVSVVCPSFVNTALIANSIEDDNKFNKKLTTFMEKCRPVEEVAESILQAVAKKIFYILPDKEVKNYSEQRIGAIIEENEPNIHPLEKIISTLHRRVENN